MENLTPTEVVTLILAIASAFILLVNTGEKIAQIVKALRSPNESQDKRMDKIEKRLDDVENKCERRFDVVEAKLDNDNTRFASITDDNRVTLRALIALLDHGLDGNNLEQMQKAKDALNDRLTKR